MAAVRDRLLPLACRCLLHAGLLCQPSRAHRRRGPAGANAVAWSTAQLVQILGSAVWGGLLLLVGVRASFAFNAGSYVVPAVSISTMAFPVARHDGDHVASSYPRAIRDGLSYARTDRFVSHMVAVQLLASCAVGGTSALLVVLATPRYHVPAASFAGFLLAIGLGALLGPPTLGSIARTYRDTRLLFAPYIVRGVGDVLLGLARTAPRSDAAVSSGRAGVLECRASVAG